MQKTKLWQQIEQRLVSGQSVSDSWVAKRSTRDPAKTMRDVRARYGLTLEMTERTREGRKTRYWKLATKAAEQAPKLSVNAAPADMNNVIDAFLIGVLASRPKPTFWQRVRGRVANAFRCA